MKFTRARLQDAWLVGLEPAPDNRGYFARTFSDEEFAVHGLIVEYPQHSVSMNHRKGTLRGMHLQCAPFEEAKLVRCLSGAIWDVIVDIRPQSATFGQWEGFELSQDNLRQLYIPKGFAHGFQTLVDATTVGYLISAPYTPAAARGFRFDDPGLAIEWPLAVSEISDKDRSLGTFNHLMIESN